MRCGEIERIERFSMVRGGTQNKLFERTMTNVNIRIMLDWDGEI